MKISTYITIAGLAWLGGCDSTVSTQAGTSSETQTSLQALADNASLIAARTMPANAMPAAARRLASNTPGLVVDTATSLIARLCSPWKHTSYGIGRVQQEENFQGVGRDGLPSSCAEGYALHRVRSLEVDSFGRFQWDGTVLSMGDWDPALVTVNFSNTMGAAYDSIEATGKWELPSGLSLYYERLAVQYNINLPKNQLHFDQTITFGSGCRLQWSFYSDEASIDAPIQCKGIYAGRLRWDFHGIPQVLDAEGATITAHPVQKRFFPEDSLGIRVLDLQTDSVEGSIHVQGRLNWKLFPGDFLVVGDSLSLGSLKTTIRENGDFQFSGVPSDDFGTALWVTKMNGLSGFDATATP